MYGYIYKTTNLTNGKIYVGQKTSPTFLAEDYLGSGTVEGRAIKKYGEDNFIVELIDTAEDMDELNEKEKYWVEKLDARNPEVGYNIAEGGSSCAAGTVKLVKGDEAIRIYEKYANSYLEDGWELASVVRERLYEEERERKRKEKEQYKLEHPPKPISIDIPQHILEQYMIHLRKQEYKKEQNRKYKKK